MPKKIAGFAAALFACCWALPAAAQNAVAQFYRGKTVTIVVGSSPGGGYDTYARLLGRHLGTHIPGKPNVVVTNMPGAGSASAATYVARVAPKDGTFIAAPYASQPLYPILEKAGTLKYDPSRMNYLGSATSDDYLCIVRSDAPATSFDAMFKTPVIMGGVAATSITGYLPILLNNLFGTKFKVVLGYPGMREIILALQKGEIQGTCGMGWTSLISQFKDLLKNGKTKIVVQESIKGLPEVSKMGVPLVVSYAHNEQQRRILEIVYSQEVFSRPYFVATEVPADRVKVLRRAVLEAWHDPALLKDAAKMNLAIGPTSGEEVQALLQKIYASPAALLRSAKAAINSK